MQWLMLQQKEAKDYVISTGRMETIRKFIELAAKQLGWNKNKEEAAIYWEGSGIDEIGRRGDTKEVVVRIDKRYFRPTEVDELLGDSTKAKKKLNWEPEITLSQLVSEMIEEDLKEAKKDAILRKEGFIVNSSRE